MTHVTGITTSDSLSVAWRQTISAPDLNVMSGQTLRNAQEMCRFYFYWKAEGEESPPPFSRFSHLWGFGLSLAGTPRVLDGEGSRAPGT